MLTLRCVTLPDPDGHNPALLLKGDWLFVLVSDGEYTGVGEASHSRDDQACQRAIGDLFDRHVRDLAISPETIRQLETGPWSAAGDLVEATAISGLNQALYDLRAQRENLPVWKLHADEPVRSSVPLYTTLNRALTVRDHDDYRRIAGLARDRGFTQIKCAPFEAVTPDSEQVKAASFGISILELLRQEFPELQLRIDFHKRFTVEAFLEVLPRIEAIEPVWIEEPCPVGPDYRRIIEAASVPLAAGELFFGAEGFLEIAENEWAHIIMPDVKHVGGYGPLLEVGRRVSGFEDLTVSPHNPSGPVSTLASVHAAAVMSRATALEVPFIADESKMLYREYFANGSISLPHSKGWGLGNELLGLLGISC